MLTNYIRRQYSDKINIKKLKKLTTQNTLEQQQGEILA